MGSITKTFVATVLLQLEAERQLSLDDTVEHWLPGVVRGNGNYGAAITLRQLLNHTSGLFNVTDDCEMRARTTGEAFQEHRYDTYTPARLLRFALAHPPDFAPGEGWRYSNTNYVLAGMVIEKVTGQGYGEQITQRVIEPLRLDSTSVPGTSSRIPGQHGRAYSTLGSAEPGATIHDVTEFNPSVAWGAGSMISTAGDLIRFYRAIMRSVLFPQRQLKEMLTTIAPDGRPADCGYGLGIFSRRLPCGVTVWGHNGDIFGSSSDAVVTRDGRRAAAFNTNADWVGLDPSPANPEFCR